MKELSENQYRILEYLKERAGYGAVPSVREIGKAVGLSSTSSVQNNLDALEENDDVQNVWHNWEQED